MADSFERIAVTVLASGQSTRFGSSDKLTAPFKGRMLGHHITDTLEQAGFARSWVIASRSDHPCTEGWTDAGFDIAINENAVSGMGSSLALAARLVLQTEATGLLICLADMPLVSLQHIRSLITGLNGGADRRMIASSNGDSPMPPAIFGRSLWPQLAKATGDKGARDLLAQAPLIQASMSELTDIDTPKALAALEASSSDI